MTAHELLHLQSQVDGIFPNVLVAVPVVPIELHSWKNGQISTKNVINKS